MKLTSPPAKLSINNREQNNKVLFAVPPRYLRDMEIIIHIIKEDTIFPLYLNLQFSNPNTKSNIRITIEKAVDKHFYDLKGFPHSKDKTIFNHIVVTLTSALERKARLGIEFKIVRNFKSSKQ